MTGVVFLKMIYFYHQKKTPSIEFRDPSSFYQISLNDLQIFQNRFYSNFFPYLSLNRSDLSIDIRKESSLCLFVVKHDGTPIDLNDVQCRFHPYGSFEYEIVGDGEEMRFYLSSEETQRQILKDYVDHSIYRIAAKKSIWTKRWIYCSSLIGSLTLLFLLRSLCR